MNMEQVKGTWGQMKGLVRKKWGELTDDDIEVIRGNREILAGKLKERYGITLEHARHQAAEFAEAFRMDTTADGHHVDGMSKHMATAGDPVDTQTLKMRM